MAEVDGNVPEAPENPDFSPLAASYARARPAYPDELFDWLASLLDRRRVAWDCATGSGQAARGLARRFERVVATDLSEEQLRHAEPNPRIHYRRAAAESSGLADGSVDLVTVAAAVHWFDLPAFAVEVERVVRPGGLLAVWTYHVGEVEPPFDKVFHRLYWEILKPYFAPATGLVDEHYETLELPGEPVAASRFQMRVTWRLAQVLEFIASWSGARAYGEARGEDPADLVREELASLWGDRQAAREIRWPLHLRVSRIGGRRR